MVPIQDTPAAVTSSTPAPSSSRPEISIRQFRDEDLVVVQQLFSDGMMYYAVEGHPQYSVWVDYIKETLATDLADLRGHYMARGGDFWVATTTDPDTNEPLTVGILGINPKPESVGELRRMSVKLEYRRYGIGQLLIEHVERWARENGFKTLTLSNGNMMTQAHNFYYKLGYKYTATTVLCPDPFYEVMHFEKHL